MPATISNCQMWQTDTQRHAQRAWWVNRLHSANFPSQKERRWTSRLGMLLVSPSFHSWTTWLIFTHYERYAIEGKPNVVHFIFLHSVITTCRICEHVRWNRHERHFPTQVPEIMVMVKGKMYVCCSNVFTKHKKEHGFFGGPKPLVSTTATGELRNIQTTLGYTKMKWLNRLF